MPDGITLCGERAARSLWSISGTNNDIAHAAIIKIWIISEK